MYVSVRYWQPDINAYGGREYTYYTDLPLVIGDVVIAPTQKAESRAIITQIGLPQPIFSCKVITKMWEEDALLNEE